MFSPKTHIIFKPLAQKSLQDLHDSVVNLPFQLSPNPEMPDISRAAESIDKLRIDMNPHKSAGHDKFKHIVLKTITQGISDHPAAYNIDQ